MSPRLVIAGVATVIVLLLVSSFFYTIGQTEQAVLLQFDAPLGVITEPGLHVKIPWVQQVEYIDKRLLNLDAPAEEVIAQDKKRMVVDAFARWRIVDPLRFYQTLINTDVAQTRLAPILSSDVRQVLGSHDFAVVLSAERAELMHDIRDRMNRETARFGIEVADVRIRHADLPPQNSAAIYSRMIQERKREAFQFRAEGAEISQRIRARAEREVTVITAEATRESDILRGQGDAQKTKILGEAYGQDTDFFTFYRSMQAYQESLSGNNTTMVVSPDSGFFKYFGQGEPAGAAKRK
jgi:membrane protease subunit HflC